MNHNKDLLLDIMYETYMLIFVKKTNSYENDEHWFIGQTSVQLTGLLWPLSITITTGAIFKLACVNNCTIRLTTTYQC